MATASPRTSPSVDSSNPSIPLRVLFVTHYFPPYNHIGAVRTGKMAKYLSAFGHSVRVVSARR